MPGGKLPEIPVVKGIHSKILAAASKPEGLDMASFHACETTHCRAGWAIHLAGKAGYELEKITGPVFAAMMIYDASSEVKVSPVRFFEDDEMAMKDMQRCAAEEAK